MFPTSHLRAAVAPAHPVATPADQRPTPMDRARDTRTRDRVRVAIGLLVVVAMVALATLAIAMSSRAGPRLDVEADRLVIDTVRAGQFEDYVTMTGHAEPPPRIPVEMIESGRVSHAVAHAGMRVEKGQVLAHASSDALELDAIRAELLLEERRQSVRRQALAGESVDVASREIARLETLLASIRRAADRLTVRAPASGRLVRVDAEAGRFYPAGSRLGEIDPGGHSRLEASLEERYRPRLRIGQTGTVEYAGRAFPVTLAAVGEVSAGLVGVVLDFVGEEPAGIASGRNLRIRIDVGAPSAAVLLSRGAFYQTSGGRWVFVVVPSSSRAERRDVRIGRQNPHDFEVLQGLRPGEQVIVSSYEQYASVRELVIR